MSQPASHFFTAEQVAATARAVMTGTLPSTSYNTSNFNAVPRRPKRKSKSEIASTKYKCGDNSKGKQKQKIETFQRKLIVFRFMGQNAPGKFTRKEHRILMRGILPEIPIDAPEYDVREEILSVIKTNVEVDMSECGIFDFEFLDACGKNISATNLKPGCTINCKTLKRMAGNGAVYVRMCKDFEELVYDPVNREPSPMPSFMEYLQGPQPTDHVQDGSETESGAKNEPLISQAHVVPPTPPPKIDLIADEASTSPSPQAHVVPPTPPPEIDLTADEASTSPSPQTPSPHPSTSQTPVLNLISETPSTSQSLTLSTEDSVVTVMPLPASPVTLFVDPEEGADRLCDIYPDLTHGQSRILLELCGHDLNKVIDFLQTPPSAARLRKRLIKLKLKRDPTDCACFMVHDDLSEEEWVQTTLAFYKGPKLLKDGYVQVYMRGQPGVDTGGVRRQFFSTVLETIAMSNDLRIFEGIETGRRPTFRSTNIPLLKVIGRMAGHCYVMDGQAFGFLSEACYYLLCGKEDKAISLLTVDDVSEGVKAIVLELEKDDSLTSDFPMLNELLDTMEQSGCDLPIKVGNRAQIVHSIMVYDALQKHKAYLDSFGEGLEEFGVLSLIRAFPEEHKFAFTIPPDLMPTDVLSILKAEQDLLGDDVLRVWNYLVTFLTKSSSEVLRAFVQEVTGLKVVQGNRIKVIISEEKEHISTHTCPKEIVISTLIDSFEAFEIAMVSVLGCSSFTIV